ncbi:MAG: InlB B-repeat-containing protein [Vulcanibacillus sp.]
MKKIFLGLFLIFGLTISFLNLSFKADEPTDETQVEYTYVVNLNGTPQTPVNLTTYYGTSISFDFGTTPENYEFVGYINQGKLVSTGETTTIRVTENTYVQYFFKPIDSTAVIFIDTNLNFAQVNYTDVNDLVAGTVPNYLSFTKPGLTSTGWTSDGLTVIDFATATFTSDTVVYPLYTTAVNDLSLTITNGTASVEGPYDFNEVVTVTANGTGTFSYWLKDGKIASLDQAYTFTVAGSHELEAVYDSDFVADSEIFVGVSGIYEDLNPGYATIVGQLNLPAGEELVEWGIITSQMAGGITLDTPDVKVFNSNKVNQTTNEFVLSFTKAVSYPNYRAFVTTINTTTSVVTTTYSYIQDSETLYTYATDLFISEYGEGGGYNKWIELYNGTSADMDLSAYKLVQYNNGSPTVTSSLTLTGLLSKGSTYVIVDSAGVVDLIALSDLSTSSSVLDFNGDDAVALVKIGSTDTIIDVIGQIGFDPGTAWTIDGVSTVNMTLVRKNNILAGDSEGSDVFNPSIEWIAYPQDTFDYIGSHTMDYNPIERPIIIDSSYTPSTITINGDSIVNVGETLSLSTTEEVVWFSSNNDILTVDQNGLVSGVAVGSATVYAYSYYNHSVFAEKTITVNEIQVYDVTFNYNDGVTTPLVVNVNGGDTVSEPTNPTRSGYQFAGWYTDAELTTLYNFSSVVTSNITLYAKWLEEFTVTFNSNGGSAVTSQTVVDGDLATEPSDPTLVSYSFAGWYSDSELTTLYNFSSAVTSDITLYAKWLEEFTVTFDSNGGSAVDSQTIADGNLATEPSDPLLDGYSFVGWYTDDDTFLDEFVFSTDTITADIILYAKWQDNAAGSLMIYEVYGGGGNTGAYYKNDYVVLYNSTDAAIDLSGYSIQYASATGTSWLKLNLTGSIAAKAYYLIQLAAGAGGVALPVTPNATGTIAMSATAGKVALVNTQIALTGATPTGASIVDLVGFGSTATAFEGTGPAPAPSNTTSIRRKTLVDGNDNASDFETKASDVSSLDYLNP